MESELVLKILQSDPFVKKYHPRIVKSKSLPDKLKKNRIYIIHCSNSNSVPKNGFVWGHYIAVDTLSKKGLNISLFDSYGRCYPHKDIEKCIKTHVNMYNASFVYNRFKYQRNHTVICAHLCIYYVLMRCRGKSLKNVQKLISQNLTYIPKMINELLTLY